MIQSSNKSNSIVQLKQFNCSIDEKHQIHMVKAQTVFSQQIKKTKLSTVRTTLPVISNVIAKEEACLSVKATTAAHKNNPTIRL